MNVGVQAHVTGRPSLKFFFACANLSLPRRDWHGFCCHRVLFKHLLHHHPGLGPLLPVQLLHLGASVDNLHQLVEHRYLCVSSATGPGSGGWSVVAGDRVHHGPCLRADLCGLCSQFSWLALLCAESFSRTVRGKFSAASRFFVCRMKNQCGTMGRPKAGY